MARRTGGARRVSRSTTRRVPAAGTDSAEHRRTGRSEPVLGTVLAFMQQLWSLDHALQSASKRMKSRLGLTGPQRLVLRLVGRTPGLSASELAQTLRLHPSTLTGVLRRLEDRGLLRRAEDASDRRRAHLHLTAAGARANEIRAGTVEAAVRRALMRLTSSEVARSKRLLSVLATELERERDVE